MWGIEYKPVQWGNVSSGAPWSDSFLWFSEVGWRPLRAVTHDVKETLIHSKDRGSCRRSYETTSSCRGCSSSML